MNEQKLDSWDEFLEIANRAIENAKVAGKVPLYKEPLFRGQANSCWALESTLYRFMKDDTECEQYDRNMRIAVTQIKTVTGIDLTYDSWKPIDSSLCIVANLEAMTWLRQNGYPSPLIDWSRSPYVASFFAFNKASKDTVSIYTYVESKTGARTSSPDRATINSVGPCIPTDRKHHLQQSRYTYCWKKNNDSYSYTSHEAGVEADESDPEQTIVTKYIIPASEREIVLETLTRMNTTMYSLFETTESLLQTLAREIFQQY